MELKDKIELLTGGASFVVALLVFWHSLRFNKFQKKNSVDIKEMQERTFELNKQMNDFQIKNSDYMKVMQERTFELNKQMNDFQIKNSDDMKAMQERTFELNKQMNDFQVKNSNDIKEMQKINLSLNKAQTELYIQELLTISKRNFANLGLEVYKIDLDKKILTKVTASYIEEVLNAYEISCLKYLDNKIDKNSFKVYEKEIKNLFQQDSPYYKRITTPNSFQSIKKVYREWKSLENA